MKSVIKLLKDIYLPRWPMLLAGIALSLIVIIANVGLLALAGWFISSMAIAGIAAISINYFTPAAIIRFLAILRTAGRYAERLLTHNTTLQLIADWRVKFYQKIEPLVPGVLENHQAADLLQYFTHDIDNIDNIYLRIVLPIVTALIMTLLLGVFVSLYQPQIAIMLTMAMLFSALAIPLMSAKAYQSAGKKLSQHTLLMQTSLNEQINTYNELTLYNMLDKYKGDFLTSSSHAIKQQEKQQRLNNIQDTLNQILISLTFSAVLLFAAYSVSNLSITAPQYAMLAFLTLAAFEATAAMPLAMQVWPETKLSMQRLSNLLNHPIHIMEPQKPQPFPQQHDINFEQISFSYQKNKSKVFNDFDLSISKNQTTAIVGSSGSGKTTLLRLLTKFEQIQSGSIRVGNVDLADINGNEIRENIAILRQNNYLFNSSITDNLKIAKPDATFEEIVHCCQQAGIHEKIISLAEQYNTWIGSHGVQLSGGEKQRLALARVLLRQAPILLLDEPSESLDRQNERYLIDSIKNIIHDKTTIIVTHKAELLQLADQVIWLEQGKVRNQGNYQELINNDAAFRRLYCTV